MAQEPDTATAAKSEGWFIPPIVVPFIMLVAVVIYAFVRAH